MQLQFLITVDIDENTTPQEALETFRDDIICPIQPDGYVITDVDVYYPHEIKTPTPDPQSLTELLTEATKVTDEIYAQYDRVRTDRLIIDTKFLLTAVKAHIRQRMARYDHNSRSAEDVRLLRKLQSSPEGLKALADALKNSK